MIDLARLIRFFLSGNTEIHNKHFKFISSLREAVKVISNVSLVFVLRSSLFAVVKSEIDWTNFSPVSGFQIKLHA